MKVGESYNFENGSYSHWKLNKKDGTIWAIRNYWKGSLRTEQSSFFDTVKEAQEFCKKVQGLK